MVGTKDKAPSDAELRKRLAAVEGEEATLSAQWAALQRELSTARTTTMHCQSPAAGPVSVRAPALAVAANRFAEVTSELVTVTARIAPLQAERNALRTALARQEAAAQVARSDAELRVDLGSAEKALEALRKDLQKLHDVGYRARWDEDAASLRCAEVHNFSPAPASDREKTWKKLQEARARTRVASAAEQECRRHIELVKTKRDELEGALDRRARGWTVPTPVSVPPLPDERLLPGERLDLLQRLLPDLQQRRARIATRLAEADTARNASRRFDRLTPYGVAQVRHADAELEYRQRLRDLVAIGERFRDAQKELSRLERQAVAV